MAPPPNNRPGSNKPGLRFLIQPNERAFPRERDAGPAKLVVNSPHNFQMNSPAPIRILSVDDHPMLRQGIAAVLASESDMVLVAEASNGREAVEQFRAHRPDVTLMDVQMPEVNGIDAIVKIREEFSDAPIIVDDLQWGCESKLNQSVSRSNESEEIKKEQQRESNNYKAGS